MKKIVTLILSIVVYSYVSPTFWGVLDKVNLEVLEDNALIDANLVSSGDPLRALLWAAWRILPDVQLILNWIWLFALLYIASLWITSLGNDTKIKEAKVKLNYLFAALVLVNIPKFMYVLVTNSDPFSTGEADARVVGDAGTFWSGANTWGFSEGELLDCGIVFCSWWGLNWPIIGNLIWLLEVIMVVVAVFFFTWGWYETMFASNDERRKQWRNRLFYGAIALFVVGILQSLLSNIFFKSISDAGVDIAYAFVQVSLYFVAPVAFVFIVLWAYMIITALGSEERMKRGRTIITNTIIATVLLLLSFSLISEIVTFFLTI